MKNLIPFVGLILLYFTACKPKMEPPKGDFTIHAEVEGVDTIIFEKIEANHLLLVDTLFAKDGEFVTANSIEGSAFFILRTPEGEGINLLLEKGEQLEISGQRNDWTNNYYIKGSIGSNQILELNQKLNKFEVAIDLIYEEAKEAQKENFEDIQNRFNSTFEEHSKYLKDFIDANLDSKVSILALFQSVKGENILNLYSDYEYYQKVTNSFQNNWPNSTHTQLLKDVVKMAFATDFSMPDINGNLVSLSDYKGKVILLDFWASWCKPCRAANPKMVKLYNNYHEKGLEMISISLDGTPQQTSPKQDWVNAIKEDKLSWTQVSDLKGLESEIRNKYPFRSIPFTVLIDTNGRVVSENISVEMLDIKIAELLNH